MHITMELQQPCANWLKVTYHNQRCCWTPREICNFPHTCHSQRSYNIHQTHDRSTSSDQCYRLGGRLIWVEVCCKWKREKWSRKHKHLYQSVAGKSLGTRLTNQLDGSHASNGAECDSFLPWEKGCSYDASLLCCSIDLLMINVSSI